MATNILDNIDLRILGELLQQARKKCGMTQADAAKVIDAARTTVIAIEKGERRLKANELIKLARAYGRSVSDFVRSRPVVQPFEVQFRAVYQRSQEQQAQIEPFILHLEELCQNYLELEKIMDAPLPHNYPLEYEVTNMPIKAVCGKYSSCRASTARTGRCAHFQTAGRSRARCGFTYLLFEDATKILRSV